jgi:glycerol-1-phosphate dehydrogenase [NAD(P)+]
MHGEQTGVGTIMMARLQKQNWRRIKSKLEKVSAPTTAEELGVKPEDVIEALVKAKKIRPERYTILDRVKLNYKSAKALAKKTGVM